ncbi:MAG: DNA polymerase III subunit delta' [Pseudomonadota bacterium]|nr:DNA polymerase III subunit delta' [Pseudomonadota bacterium]
MKWLQQYRDRLNRTRVQGRLPHALLISGQDGVGKRVLAEQFAHSLLCEQPAADGQACGQCASCGWLQAGTHPDLLWLVPEEAGKAIKVDQVRALSSELCMTSHAGRYKLVIIQPADAMNTNAANSLLKTLEEPSDNTLVMLLTALPGRLPATIRSRCQQLQVAVPDALSAQQWLQDTGMESGQAIRYLKLANGAPLKAQQLAETDSAGRRDQCLQQLVAVYQGSLDPIETAKQWMGESERQSLDWWRAWLQDMLRWQQGRRPPLEPEVAQKLQRIVETVDCRQLFDLLDKVANALNSLGSGLNRQLILEDLLIFWARLADLASYRPTAAGR